MLGWRRLRVGDVVALDDRVLAVVGDGVEVEIEGLAGEELLARRRASCQAASRLRASWRESMREEYSERKLFLGMALRPQNSARPSSATRAMTWLLRSIDQSLRARQARRACAAGIILEPGSWAACGEPVELEADQVRDEQEEPAAGGGEAARARGRTRATSATASTVGPRRGRAAPRRGGAASGRSLRP